MFMFLYVCVSNSPVSGVPPLVQARNSRRKLARAGEALGLVRAGGRLELLRPTDEYSLQETRGGYDEDE
ncbi:unnamed protein product [Danaus chrysippus]|uniref:(African queen) hypothetical protein n=1 Tax=Danaus chrysippus TaxID=151541 RepID=A0A8J2VRT0_9NEOP|nr:unnamed protein product [Danaus chrysippus]